MKGDTAGFLERSADMAWGRALFLTLLLLAGSFPASYAAGGASPDGIVKFEMHADESLPARTVSFGQIFLPGTVRSGDVLQVMLDGHAAPAQLDAKAFNADGSVRHAVLTVELPKLRSGQTLSATVVKQAGAPAVAPAGDFAVPPLDVVVGLKDAKGAIQKIDINLQTVAQNPKNAAPGFWLNGPLAQERRYMADVNDHVQILFDVFVPRTGPARIDVIFHNDWTGIHHGDGFDYDVDMSSGRRAGVPGAGRAPLHILYLASPAVDGRQGVGAGRAGPGEFGSGRRGSPL